MLAHPILIAVLASTLIAAQAATPDRDADIKRAMFDLCPKVFTGDLSLTDPTQLAAIGYKMTPPRETPGGKVPRAEIGEGSTKIVIAGHGGKEPSCSVWFGGPDNRDRLGKVLTDASAAGFKVGQRARLGDNTPIFKATRASGVPKVIAIIIADAGGEFGSDPASTIIFLN